MKLKTRSCIVALAALGASLAPAAEVTAQSFPSKPVRIIVPWPAGGGSDIVARILTQKMGEGVGQQFVVDNRGGAAGIIGTALAAKASADGYTILLGNSATNVTNAVLHSNLGFDVVKAQVAEKFAAQGVDTVGNTPEEFARLIASELTKWRKLAAEVGIKAD